MALQAEITQLKGMLGTVKEELLGQQGYFKITNIFIDSNDKLNFMLGVYLEGKELFGISSEDIADSYEEANCVLNKSENVYFQVYMYLKALPGFKDAIDV